MKIAGWTALAALLTCRVAAAHCGGGGGHGHGAPACHEISAVVGHETCSHFGDWDADRTPRLVFRGGLGTYAFHSPDLAADRPLDAVAIEGRVAWFPVPRLYVATELGLGAVVGGVPSEALPENTESSHPTYASLGAALGIALPLGIVQVRSELFAGGRTLSVPVHMDDCDPDTTFWRSAILEPRLGIDFWTSPLVSIGAVAGVDLAEVHGAYAGFGAALHMRSFDGA